VYKLSLVGFISHKILDFLIPYLLWFYRQTCCHSAGH